MHCSPFTIPYMYVKLQQIILLHCNNFVGGFHIGKGTKRNALFTRIYTPMNRTSVDKTFTKCRCGLNSRDSIIRTSPQTLLIGLLIGWQLQLTRSFFFPYLALNAPNHVIYCNSFFLANFHYTICHRSIYVNKRTCALGLSV